MTTRIVSTVAALLSLTAFLVFGYGWYNYTALDKHLQRRNIAGLSAPTKVAATPGQTGHVDGVDTNILIVGDDSRDGLTSAQQKQLHVGSDDGTNSTDTIMIVHVPANGAKATLISIPRDSWVEIPGYGMGKINSAYHDGYDNAPGKNPTDQQRQTAGSTELVATVEKLTGASINHYVQIGFGGFYTIAKAIGGINVNLCDSVDDTAARNRAEGVVAGSGFVMSAGHHHLNAVESLEFVRQRHNLPGPDGNDIGREARQRYFLAQAFGAIASAGVLLNPIKLNNLINTLTGAFFVDAGFSLKDFANQMLDLHSGDIVGTTIPVITIDGWEDGQSVVSVDPAQVKTKVAQIIATGDAPQVVPTSSSPPGTSSSASSSASSPAPDAPSSSAKPKTPAGCIY